MGDGRILVNDHIIEVNGISLVGVSQKLAAQTLSNCAISPETGTVHFVLARPRTVAAEADTSKQENKCDESKAVLEKEDKICLQRMLKKKSAVIRKFSQIPEMLSLKMLET